VATTISERVQKRRDAMRQAGLRPIQLWVPDTRHPTFAAECHRQSMLLHRDPQEAEVLDWIESVADLEGWAE
jgi:hypothetical protein